MRVLIATEQTADDRKTLAAVRATAMAGAEITVGSDSRWSPPLWSRYSKHRVYYPSPVTAPQQFDDWLLAHTASHDYDLILPLSDYTTFALSCSQEKLLEYTGLAVPPKSSLERAHDKLATLKLAKSLGIGIPRTGVPANRQELLEISTEIDYPCVFKLRRGAGGIGLAFPQNPRELLQCYDARATQKSDQVMSTDLPLVQEYIPGSIHDACLLFNHGEVAAASTQERLWMWPPTGGIGIYNQSTDEPALLEQAQLLLCELQWHGPAMVEFKLDTRDNNYKLMEINSRFWGTLDAAVSAGTNFPWLTCLLATGQPLPVEPRHQIGKRYWWPLPHGWNYLHHKHSLPATALSFYRQLRSTSSDLSLADPLPHLVDACARITRKKDA